MQTSPPDNSSSSCLSRVEWTFLILAALATISRFVFLAVSPPGFYVDEAAISAQIICLKQSGADLNGHHFPLFAPVLAGGYVTPLYLYGGVIWSLVFADSTSAMRGFAALGGALTIVGIYFLSHAMWRNRRAALLAALCAALSPWAFQFSRIAWDPAWATAPLVWGLYFVFRNGNRPKTEGVAAGILLSLAMYTYPPLRAHVLGVLALAAWIMRKRAGTRTLFASLGIALLIVSIPLIESTTRPEFLARTRMLSVFNEDYLKNFGPPSAWLALRLIASNIALHLSPKYLFFSGDGNLRHSSQAVGEWGWLEIAAMLTLLSLLLTRKAFRKDEHGTQRMMLTFCGLGYLLGVLPACLTWESNPHALRAIAAWPYLSLASGWVLMRATEAAPRFKSQLEAAVVALSIAFAAYFYFDYFVRYPERSAAWFETAISEKAEALKASGELNRLPEEAARMINGYPAQSAMYFQLRDKAVSCAR